MWPKMVFCMNFQIEVLDIHYYYIVPYLHVDVQLWAKGLSLFTNVVFSLTCLHIIPGDWLIVACTRTKVVQDILLHFRHLRELNKGSWQSKQWDTFLHNYIIKIHFVVCITRLSYTKRTLLMRDQTEQKLMRSIQKMSFSIKP